MPRGYRSVIIATCAGLIALWAALAGFNLGALNNSEQEGYQSYRYTPDNEQAAMAALDLTEQSKPMMQHQPCRDPHGHDESDLCAQWRAAKAAEASAWWAKWSFWIGMFGVGGLLATIVQGRIALERAREANRIARESSEHQLRAYVFPKELEWKWFKIVPEKKKGIELKAVFRNLGSTNTKRLRFSALASFDINPYEPLVICEPFDDTIIPFGPGDEVRTDGSLAFISEADIEDVYHNRKHLYFMGAAFYSDVFSDVRHSTRFCWRISFQKDIDEKKVNYVGWDIIGPNNGTEDEWNDPSRPGKP